MGCACVKSDVIVKNQRINKQSSANNSLFKHASENAIIPQPESGNNQNNMIRESIVSRNNQNIQNNNINHNIINQNNNSELDPRHINNNNHRDIRQVQNQIVNSIINNFPGLNSEPYLQSRSDPNFNFPEIENVYEGKGLKKMKGYISTISEPQIVRIRREFWGIIKKLILGTRTEGNPEIWQLLETICTSNEIEETYIKEFLNAAGVSLYNNCLNITYDSQGIIYEIPNYCINNPHKYELHPKENKIKPNEQIITVIIRKGIDEKNIEINNLDSILNLKQAITHIGNLKDIDFNKIRLFFSGKELKNDEEIWLYNILNESIVQMMYVE